MKQISRLQYITTSAINAEQACKAGVDWVQLRLKNISFNDYKTIAIEVQAICKQYGAKLIINDNVDVAIAIQADGVHLGKDDMSHAEARLLLGDDYIIGGSTNTVDDIIRLSQESLDYLGVGPFRFTSTKEKLNPIVGLDGYKRIIHELKNKSVSMPPLVGIGGIEEKDVVDIISAGLYGVAVSGAISHAAQPALAAEKFLQLCNQTLVL